MKVKPFSYPVYAIPPSFSETETLEIGKTVKYVKYLEKGGASCIMTTAGTSQFNLMTSDELRFFNKTCVQHFKGSVILGLHAAPTKMIMEEIEWLREVLDEEDHHRVGVLLLFPDRYYNDDQLLDYFGYIANNSPFPILVHGNSLRKGYGGVFEYNGDFCVKLAQHSNIVGMKEECSSWDLGYKLCREVRLADEDFGVIVAGGSQKRYMALRTAGANSFLTGIGNIYPEISETFYSLCNKNIKDAEEFIREFEEPFFDVFMKIGWHAAMREALKIKGLLSHDRDPFIKLEDDKKAEIVKILDKIESKIKDNEDIHTRTV